jgi:hypothetical protein
MVKLLLLAFSIATGTSALWLVTTNMDYGSAVGNAVFSSSYCQVGKGNTREEAHSKASSTVGGTALLAGGHCDLAPYRKNNQFRRFCNDYGSVNYEDDN